MVERTAPISPLALRNRPPRWLALTMTALVAGCTLSPPVVGHAPLDDPPTSGLGSYAGTLQPSCSPVDAMALALELEAEQTGDPTRISVLLWPPDALQAGAAFGLDDRSGPTAAAIWAAETEWHLAIGGGIWVDAFQAEQGASGRFRLEFDGGRRLEGRFQARWFDPGPVFCG